LLALGRVNIQSEEDRASRPLDLSNPPTYSPAPAGLGSQNPISARFHDHDILEQTLVLDPKGQLVSVEMAKKRDLLLR
jgi:hypothetical protein